MSNRLMLIFTIFFTSYVRSNDEYVEELKRRCNATKRPFSCTKYKLFDLLNNHSLVAENSERALGGFVRFVKIDNDKVRNETGRFFDESRYFGDDTEVMKMLKFVQRKTERFLENQGLAFSLPDGTEVVDDGEMLKNSLETLGESRGKKGHKRKSMIIPLIMLFKLFKIKVLVSLVLLSVLFVKKAIIVTAMFLPSIIQSIKNHCKLSYHVVPHHIEEEHHEHDVTGTGWAGYSGYAYGNDIDKSRIQRIYHPHYYYKG